MTVIKPSVGTGAVNFKRLIEPQKSPKHHQIPPPTPPHLFDFNLPRFLSRYLLFTLYRNDLMRAPTASLI